MISLALIIAQLAQIETFDPLDQVVHVDEGSVSRFSLRSLTYACDMKDYDGRSFRISFARSGGEAFLTGNERIPLGRRATLITMLSNSSPYPLDSPSRVYASEAQTILSYDNPGYVPMNFNAAEGQAYLTFNRGTTDRAGNSLSVVALYGKCAVVTSGDADTARLEKDR